jgi:hypothetical protein
MKKTDDYYWKTSANRKELKRIKTRSRRGDCERHSGTLTHSVTSIKEAYVMQAMMFKVRCRMNKITSDVWKYVFSVLSHVIKI